MMMVKVEAREFRLKEIIDELEQTRAQPHGDSGGADQDQAAKPQPG
jgi:hypothetical protein